MTTSTKSVRPAAAPRFDFKVAASWALKGVEGLSYKPRLKGKVVMNRPCKKCNFKSGLLFQSLDETSYMLVCPRCKKYEILPAIKENSVLGRCKAIKKDGKQCKYTAISNGFCKVHKRKVKEA